MSVSTNHSPRGRSFVRSLIARHFKLSPESIANRWGPYEAELIQKAVVSALSTSGTTGNASSAEFLGLVREGAIIGRLPGIRRVPIGVRLNRMTSGSVAHWVGEAKPKPLSKPALDGSRLASRKVVALVCTTKESMQPTLTGEAGLTEANLQEDLQRAVIAAMDEAFIDAANAGVADIRPASITSGAPTIASSGDPSTDVAALINAFQGNLDAAAFITDPTTATRLALARDAGGGFLFPDLGPRGGTLLQIPVLTSRASPVDTSGGQIALVDASGLVTSVEGLQVEISDEADLLMSDDPEGGGAQLVSLFQTNSVAFKVEIVANWEQQRTGGVVVLTGASF